MKRSAALAAVALVALTPMMSSAAPKTTRTEVFDYTGFYALTSPAANTAFLNPCPIASACFTFTLTKAEQFVTMDVVDQTGQPTAVQYSLNDEYTTATVFTICGKGSFKVKGGTALQIKPAIDPTCPGVPTSGTITVTASNEK
jgi:hypothetical protein